MAYACDSDRVDVQKIIETNSDHVQTKILYDFGVTQYYPGSEIRTLNPVPGHRILCIASAGEVPLELLVNRDPYSLMRMILINISFICRI